MEQYENIYDKIQELLGDIPGNLSILEQQIDADVQLEYYEYSKKLNNHFNPQEILRKREAIFNHDFPVEDKKKMMVRLASIDSIEAYRTLEKYNKDSSDQLKDWAALAMQECKLLLESKLLDESQVLISTGLGGKGLKLRYFTVFLSASDLPYTAFQKKLITNEIRFAIRRSGGETEKVRFNREICTVLSIIPLKIPIQALFDGFIQECNQYGQFIKPDYMITNVRIISNNEIREIAQRSRTKNKTRMT